jgi:hypothetical protein
MQRRPLKKTAPYVIVATGCGLALAAAAGCGNSPASNGTNTTAGTGNIAGTPATGGGGAASTAGAGTAGGVVGGGSMGGNGTAGNTTTGGGGAGTGGGGGGGASVACKAGTPLNGSGLTLAATDISAFKYAPPPAAHITKMAYDPVSMVVVMVNGDDGKLYSFDPKVALPATAMNAAITTAKAYDAGYTVPAGYGTGVYQPFRGLAFGPDGALYVMAAKEGGVAISKGAPPAAAGGARTWTTIVTTSMPFPKGMADNYNHSFSGIAVSADGKSLFFSSGSRTEHGEPEGGGGDGREAPLSSAIFKVPTDAMTDLKNDATALMPFMFADGTRNTFDLAFNAAGDLIGTENGPDIDLPDEVNFLEQGKHYGFPWRFGNVDNPTRDAAFVPASDKRLRATYGGYNLYKYDAAFPPPPAGGFVDPIMNYGPAADYGIADANSAPAKMGDKGLAGVTSHRSPLGLSFDNAGASCGEYYKQGFMLSYGPIPGGSIGDLGEDLLLVSLTKADGKYTMKAKQLASGIKQPMDSVLVGNRLFTIGQGDAAQVFVFVLPTP